MKTIATNRRARHDYEILETIVAGVVLAGHEVKSVKGGQVSLKGSFIAFSGGEAWLTNAHIRQYTLATTLKDYSPTRPRKLLLQRAELERLESSHRSQGLSVVPLKVGVVRGLVKIEIALGRGRKRYDKRAVARQKAMKRDALLDSKQKLNT